MEILFFHLRISGRVRRLYKLYENVYYEKNKMLLFEKLLSILGDFACRKNWTTFALGPSWCVLLSLFDPNPE